MRTIKLTALAAAALLLASCGFRPLYGEHAPGVSSAHELSAIQLNTMNSRVDYLVRGNLIEKLQLNNAPGLPRYELVLRLKDDREGVAIEADTSITRYNYRLVAKYDLIDVTTRETLYSGVSRSIAAYNVVDDQFATMSAQRHAQERTALDISDDIKLKLAVFFDRQMSAE